jgi:hypothetical protein
MKSLLAFMSHLMLFLTLATLVTAFAAFLAHKLKQRRKPARDTPSTRAKQSAPSMVQAYEPRRDKTVKVQG